MVAHTATSPAPSWNPEPRPLAPILPPPSITDDLLDDLASTEFSLAVVALKHSLSLSQLLAWLNLSETREALALRESAAYAHTRHVAALNMDQAVRAVASIIHEYAHTAPARDARDRARPGSAHREAMNARKAAWLLLQFARIVPVNEADLRRATGCLPASAKDRATGCAVGGPTSANSNSRTPALVPQSSLPSPTLHAAGALPDLPPASALKADADFSRVACLLEEQACSESESAERTSSSHRTANVSERTSPRVPLVPVESASADSTEPALQNSRANGCLPTSANSSTPVPSKSASDFDALSVLVPASSLQDDANSQEQASSESATPSHGCASAAMPPDHDRSPPSPRSPLSLSRSVPLPLSTPAPSTSSTRAPPAPAFV